MTWIFAIIALIVLAALAPIFGKGGPPYGPGDRLPVPQRALQDHRRGTTNDNDEADVSW